MNEDRCGRCGSATRPSLFRGVPMRTCPNCDTITVGRADLSTLLGAALDGQTPAGRPREATAVSVPHDLRSEPMLELPRSGTPGGARPFTPGRPGPRDPNPYAPRAEGTPGRFSGGRLTPGRFSSDELPRLDTDEVPTVFGPPAMAAAPMPAPMPPPAWPEPAAEAPSRATAWHAWMGFAGLVVAAAFLTTAWTVATWSRAPEPPATPVPVQAAPAPVPQDPVPVVPAPAPEPPPAPIVAQAPAPEKAPPTIRPPRARAGASVSALIGEGWSQVESSPSQAADAFGRALEARPGDPEASYGMGYALLRLGQTDRAVGHLCRAMSGSSEVRREVSALLARHSLNCG